MVTALFYSHNYINPETEVVKQIQSIFFFHEFQPHASDWFPRSNSTTKELTPIRDHERQILLLLVQFLLKRILHNKAKSTTVHQTFSCMLKKKKWKSMLPAAPGDTCNYIMLTLYKGPVGLYDRYCRNRLFTVVWLHIARTCWRMSMP